MSSVGTFETFRDVRASVANRGKADVARTSHFGSDLTPTDIRPKRPWCNPSMRVVCSYGPLPVSTPSGLISIGSGLFSNPAAIRDLPGVVIRSLPCRSTMYPSSINRARCPAGIIAGGWSTAHVLPTISSEANSSLVSIFNLDAIIGLCPVRELGCGQFCSSGNAYYWAVNSRMLGNRECSKP